jgi:hypothetical protein
MQGPRARERSYWNQHVVCENGGGSLKWEFDGITLEASDQNAVIVHVDDAPQVKEKLLAKMRTDFQKYGLERCQMKNGTRLKNQPRHQKVAPKARAVCCNFFFLAAFGYYNHKLLQVM